MRKGVCAGAAAILAILPRAAHASDGSPDAASSKASILVTVPKPLERPVADVLKDLRKGTPAERISAAWEISSAGEASPEIVEALKANRESPVEPVAGSAIWALGWLHDLYASKPAGEPPFEDTPGKLLHRVDPDYPKQAFLSNTQGTLQIAILVSASGEVVHAGFKKSNRYLDMAALNAVARWRFAPAQRAGKPVPCYLVTNVSFRIYPAK